MSDRIDTSEFDSAGLHTSAGVAGDRAGEHGHPPLRTYMFRLLAVVGLCGFFVLTATVIQPQDSNASMESVVSPTPAPTGAILGRLRGSEQEVVIRAGANGPQYDLFDIDGSLIAGQLTYTELSRRLAELSSDVIMPDQRQMRMGIVDDSLLAPLPDR